MRVTEERMGMPVTIDVYGTDAERRIERVMRYFQAVDDRFSTYKETSEISRSNRGELTPNAYSPEMTEIFELAEATKAETNGYFDIEHPDGSIDPSGLVKGWAIRNASDLLRGAGYGNHYIEIGGDIQVSGQKENGDEWRLGIRNPFNRDEIVKVIRPGSCGVATSGTAIRGAHIYDPHTGEPADPRIASLTVIGPDIYEADRFATAAFAMGPRGIEFIEALDGFEAYLIDEGGMAIYTSGFETYL